MEFNPTNPIIQLCLKGMSMEETGKPVEASHFFLQAWNEATNDFEKYLAAYYVGCHQKDVFNKLKWLETSLEFALKINNETVQSALPTLYGSMAKCYEELNEPAKATKNNELAAKHRNNPQDKGPFYHGTKADLQVGDFLKAGYTSNYHPEVTMNHIYFTALVNGAGLAAALAPGNEAERVYIVEPTGSFENDPNVTDKKFPGNPTRSYRSKEPLKIVGEVTDWVRITPEELANWRERLAKMRAEGRGEIIN